MYNNNKLFLFPVISICSMLLLFSACTTTKNTFMHRGWHNMNSRYNGYFYARENMKEAVLKVETEYKDDYGKLLPIFIYPTNETAKGYAGDFDKTIKKSSTVIQRHAITTPKSKEEITNACRWIDENYMLIGKCHFYKRDYFAALEVFTYVAEKYPNPPAKYQGMLWMVHTDNEIGSLSLSEPLIDEIRNAKDLPKNKWRRKSKRKTKKSFQREFTAVTADYYIKRIDYGPAITNLTELIAITKKKKVKARYTFILAQLYQKQGDNKNASMYFGKVSKLHPSYDMAFNAKINQAKLYDSEMGDSKYIKKQLLKMMRDDKNIEYLDQIYYALAQIAYQEKDIPLAISYLDKSILNSTTNNAQKALSFLKRADIYFEKPNYKLAEANYDSAMVFLPLDYPDYERIANKKASLNDLIKNLNVIALEDSLQVLSKMTDKERERAVEIMIVKLEEEEKRKEEERQRQIAYQQNQAQNAASAPAAPVTAGAWYFYNPTTVSFGISEFKKKWGDRKSENNWRRSEKEQEASAAAIDDQGNTIDTVVTTDAAVAATNSNSSVQGKDFYLKNIPLTPEAIKGSNSNIIEAYYNVGTIYKEELLNTQKSIEAFEELLRRYPDNKFKLSIYYQLYRTYLGMNNQPKAEYYKNILLKEYPDSEYSRIIKNPEYGKAAMASKSIVENFYAETYQLYKNGKYLEVIANCNKADTAYTKNNLMPQFDYLKALSIGRTGNIDELERALTHVIITYPKAPVQAKAQEILDLIKNKKALSPAAILDSTAVLPLPANPAPVTSTTVASTAATPVATDSTKLDSIQVKSPYTFKETGDYYWLIMLNNGKANLPKLKGTLNEVNTANFKEKNLITAISTLDETHQFIHVRKFDGKTKAMDYYNFMNSKKELYTDLEPGSYQSFIISAENYAIFYKDKSISKYQQFFMQNFH